MDTVPRITRIGIVSPAALQVDWRHGSTDQIDLASWIATGGRALSALSEPAVFAQATIADYGSDTIDAASFKAVNDGVKAELDARGIAAEPETIEAKDLAIAFAVLGIEIPLNEIYRGVC